MRAYLELAGGVGERCESSHNFDRELRFWWPKYFACHLFRVPGVVRSEMWPAPAAVYA